MPDHFLLKLWSLRRSIHTYIHTYMDVYSVFSFSVVEVGFFGLTALGCGVQDGLCSPNVV